MIIHKTSGEPKNKLVYHHYSNKMTLALINKSQLCSFVAIETKMSTTSKSLEGEEIENVHKICLRLCHND